jgi:hypothetical protein
MPSEELERKHLIEKVPVIPGEIDSLLSIVERET